MQKNQNNTNPIQKSDRNDIETDNQGRQLSKQQQEFFKDSKVRDENGNLSTVYRRSQKNTECLYDAKL